MPYRHLAYFLLNAQILLFFFPTHLIAAIPFNFVIGTQTLGATYHFQSNQSILEETASAISLMGSNILKYNFSNDENFTVTDMTKFYYNFLVWRSSSKGWFNGLDSTEKNEEYKATYALAKELLIRYNNTGRTFFLGHTEGDWLLIPSQNPAGLPSSRTIQGMIDWLNTRQKAINDAKHDVHSVGVMVYHYTEVNRVRDAMNGLKRVANFVLPYVKVDYVSYSSFDVQDTTQSEVNANLNYLASQLAPNSNIVGKRVFIGEFGIPQKNAANSSLEHERKNRQVLMKFIEWGAPFVLYWQVYNNNVDDDGNQIGNWLIDNNNQKVPLYYTFQKLYSEASEWILKFHRDTGTWPTSDQYQNWVIVFLQNSS